MDIFNHIYYIYRSQIIFIQDLESRGLYIKICQERTGKKEKMGSQQDSATTLLNGRLKQVYNYIYQCQNYVEEQKLADFATITH